VAKPLLRLLRTRLRVSRSTDHSGTRPRYTSQPGLRPRWSAPGSPLQRDPHRLRAAFTLSNTRVLAPHKLNRSSHQNEKIKENAGRRRVLELRRRPGRQVEADVCRHRANATHSARTSAGATAGILEAARRRERAF